ncbi:MAG: Pycsar system effector family protein [Bacteroidota bacterium]
MEETINILEETAAYVQAYLDENMPIQYVYHNINHTVNVVNSAKEIASGNELSEQEVEDLLIAAWFHDIGYTEGPKDHEDRSITEAEKFLSEKGFPEERIKAIGNMIMATKMPQRPQNKIEEILCDADLSSLGDRRYFDQVMNLREEWETTGQKTFTEESWLLLELDFLSNHEYHNEYSRQLYDKRKKKNIEKLKKRLAKLKTSSFLPTMETTATQPKKKDKGKGKAASYSRGVETMFRSTYRMHINLSAIADNKANIMLSINAIIISIMFSEFLDKIKAPQYMIPAFILMGTCLISIIYATLSTRPKITEGKFTKDDIINRRSNLLFFGNFYNMTLDDYEYGIGEMLNDNDFLYGSMTRDVYFLGVVLAKKYKFLRTCYTVFMWGIILTVFAFVTTYIITRASGGPTTPLG